MITVKVPEIELYDSSSGTFINYPSVVLRMEHSLLSISKWESKWKKPFINKVDKTDAETYDYIKCMVIGDEIDDLIIRNIPASEIARITNYISDPMTATTINNTDKSKPNREIITSELIYYWMIALNIPFECQHWNLNRLMTLISICNIKNSPPKKQSKKDLMSRNAALNAARKKAMKTSG